MTEIDEFPFQRKTENKSSEKFVCDICDREFETKRGKNIHLGQNHEED